MRKILNEGLVTLPHKRNIGSRTRYSTWGHSQYSLYTAIVKRTIAGLRGIRNSNRGHRDTGANIQ